MPACVFFIDIAGPRAASSRTFYSAVLGWEIELGGGRPRIP